MFVFLLFLDISSLFYHITDTSIIISVGGLIGKGEQHTVVSQCPFYTYVHVFIMDQFRQRRIKNFYFTKKGTKYLYIKDYITYSNTLSNYFISFYFTFFQIASGDNRSVVTSEPAGRTILQRHEAENLDTTLTAIEEAHVDLRARRQAELIRETARRGNTVMIRVSPKTARIISFMENLDLV